MPLLEGEGAARGSCGNGTGTGDKPPTALGPADPSKPRRAKVGNVRDPALSVLLPKALKPVVKSGAALRADRNTVGVEDGGPEEAAGPGHRAVRMVALGRGVKVGDADDAEFCFFFVFGGEGKRE